eukprot:4397788-Pleurochrysis_carterae.AAC.1
MTYHTGKRSSALRWEDYKAAKIQAGLPVIHGSHSLFKSIWKEHTEIKEYSAKHHPKCDRLRSTCPRFATCRRCGELKAMKDRFEYRTDPEGRAQRSRVHEMEVRSNASNARG